MMIELFENIIHYLGQNHQNIFCVSVGAMDGVMFDELYEPSKLYGFKGLYIEPIPYLFKRLKCNLGEDTGNIYECCAISDYDGEIDMITIDQDVIEQGLVHSCFYGMSAVWPPKNGLGSQGDSETVQNYGKRIKVQCRKLSTVLEANCIRAIDVIKIDAEGHDYQVFRQIDFDRYKPSVVRLEWINLNPDDKERVTETFRRHHYLYQIEGMDITAVRESVVNAMNLDWSDTTLKIRVSPTLQSENNITLVTGLWDLKRDGLQEGWSISYDNYLERFAVLLKNVPNNMIIFGDRELESIVWQCRDRTKNDTLFILREKDWFRHNDYYSLIQSIRQDENWSNQTGWLSSSPQASLELYNPVVTSKMFLLNDARISDPFNSSRLFWIDAGITATVHPGYFSHDRVLDGLPKFIDKFTFITFPYNAVSEIHGFSYPKICEYAGTDVKKVARGGFFGGPKDSIARINGIYYSLLMSTLKDHYMGTEESIFSILLYRYRSLVRHFMIQENGLLGKFFEDLKTRGGGQLSP